VNGNKQPMSEITDDPSSDTIPSLPTGPDSLRKVGGVIIPSRTWVPFLAGAIGGMSGAILTAPLDVVKTRLQSDFYKDRLQAAKASGVATSRVGVYRHLVETGVILRYYPTQHN
jgi:Mitochondrial carrier protein